MTQLISVSSDTIKVITLFIAEIIFKSFDTINLGHYNNGIFRVGSINIIHIINTRQG